MNRLDTLVRKVVEAREEYEAARKTKTKAEKRKNEAERILHDHLNQQNTPSASVEIDGRRISVSKRSTRRARIIDRDVLVAALGREGLDDGHTYVEVRKGALNDLIRSRLERGEDLPDGVDFSETRFVTLTERK